MKKKALLLCCFAGLGWTVNAQYWMFSDPQKLGGTVNNEASEESVPVFSKDSSILYFVRTFDSQNRGGEFDQDIWFSKREADGSYTDCQQLKALNNKYNNAVVGLGGSGSSMYLLNAYEGKKDTIKGIAVSRKSGTSWSRPEAVEIPSLNINGLSYGFHVSEAENVIIISHQGPGSLGEEDLYVSTLADGSWSKPMHMGDAINTSGFEISPHLNATQDTLFFSSNGHGGEGDADIFYAVKQGAWNQWSKPKNLGPVINSPKFDAFFVPSGNRAFWSSNREGERSDIYTVDILTPPPLSASLVGTDVTVYQGSDGTIDLTVEGGVAPFSYAWSNGSVDEDLTGLPKGDYAVMVTDAVGQEVLVKTFIDEPPMELDPVIAKTFESITFEHFFSYNRNKVKISRAKMKEFLKGVKEQLEERETITIKVFSSASRVPTKKYGSNEELTRLRAENMKYDLVAYFDKKKKYKGKVAVVIDSYLVQGPDYQEDARDKSKYEPFQYVKLATE